MPQSKRGVEALKDIARAELLDGKPLIENQSFAEKIADLEIQVTALEYTELRVLSSMAHGGQPGPEVSGLKIRGSGIQQRLAGSPWKRSANTPRPTCPACCGRAQRGAGRPVLRPHRGTALFQHAQNHDLWRQQRDPEGHHRQVVWGCDGEKKEAPMDLALKPEHKAFADEVRASPATPSPATKAKTFSGKHYDRDDHMAWQQALGRQGWLAYTSPRRNTAARAGTSRNASCSRTCWPKRARRR